MKNIVILENIRSAYNTGNIIRTADALGREVVISGYTPNPEENTQVSKTSLGAEETVVKKQFRNTSECLQWARKQGYILVASEITQESISLSDYLSEEKPLAFIMGNEKTGVLEETLDFVDHVVYIPMKGMKESLNVGQAAAIIMREISKQ